MAISTVFSPGEVVALANNVEQGFRIRAVNVAGPGEWSNTDVALAGWWTYSPGNGGGGTTFHVPSGVSSFVYQISSNGGASSKPDTRTYSTAWPLYVDWFGPEVLPYWPSFGIPEYWDYHRQYDWWSWWSYLPDWTYINGNLQYGWGNFRAGDWEYYYMNTSGSGPGWSHNQHVGWARITPSGVTIQTGGSPAAGPTYGGQSSINVPGWGSDSTGQGYNAARDTRSGTAFPNPNAGVTVNIGASQGDYSYSSPGEAIIAYAK